MMMDGAGNVAVRPAAAVDVKKPTLSLNPRPLSRWKFDVDTDALQYSGRENVVLVLGDPNENVIHNLVRSPHLSSNCLLILASHSLPVHLNTLAASLKESNSTSSICMLRLSSELALYEDGNGAARLVRILERAQQIAMLWRKANKDEFAGVIEEVFENVDDIGKPDNGSGRRRHERRSSSNISDIGEHGSASRVSLLRINNTSSSSPPPSFSRDLSRRPSKLFGRSTTISPRGQKTISVLTHAHRTIDTIIHILPSHEKFSQNPQNTQSQHPQPSRLMRQPLTDKSLLKSVVLVTTLSRPFLLHPGEDRDRTNAFEKQFTFPSQPSLRYNKGDRGQPHSLAKKSLTKSRIFGSSVTSFNIEKGEDGQRDIDHRPIPNRSKTLASSHPTSITEKSAEIDSDAWMKTLTECNAKIIHILPSYGGMKNLINPLVIQRLEAFLLTFCSPRPQHLSKKDKEKEKGKEKEKSTGLGFEFGTDVNTIVPYLIDLSLLSSKVPISQILSHPHPKKDVTILDLVLSGSLDGRSAFDGQLRRDSMGAKWKDMDDEKGISIRRAWISGLDDIDLNLLLKASHETVMKQESEHVATQNQLTSLKSTNSRIIHPSSPLPKNQVLTQPLGSTSRKEISIVHLSPSKAMNDETVTKSPLVRPRTAGSLNSEFKSYPSLYVLNENRGNEDNIGIDRNADVNESSDAYQYHYTRTSTSRSPSPLSSSSPEFNKSRINSSLPSTATTRFRSESFNGSGYIKDPFQDKGYSNQWPKMMSESTPHLPNGVDSGISKANSKNIKDISTITSTLSLSAETGRDKQALPSKNATLEDVKADTRSIRREKSIWKFWRSSSDKTDSGI